VVLAPTKKAYVCIGLYVLIRAALLSQCCRPRGKPYEKPLSIFFVTRRKM